MKKYISLFLIVLSFLLCLCGCQKDNVQSNETNSETLQNTAEEKDTVKEEDKGEALAEKLIKEIDDAYLKESELPEYGTTLGMTELADIYTEKLKQISDEYYNKIMEYDGDVTPNNDYNSSDELHTFVSEKKADWEEYSQKQCEDYAKKLQSDYEGGTIAGPSYAVYKYELQKEWLKQIVGIYEQLNT